jgi:hypothetical protein
MNFSHVYRSCIRKSLDEDRAEIATAFQDIVKRRVRVDLRLVNYHKGLPISYPATLVDADRGLLELDLHQQQAVVLNATRYTFIKCDHFHCAILAEVQSVNLRQMAASLRNFAFVEIMAEQRNTLRLELEPQTDAEIRGTDLLMPGKVLDLSLEGVSLLPEEHCELKKGAEVMLRVMVPNLLHNTLTPLETKATHIVTTGPRGSQICRFSFPVDTQSQALISRYIFQRQVEIIRELKEQT